MPATEEILELLTTGRVDVVGQLPYSSNYTFAAKVVGGDEEVLAVYKPVRGEQPLWDFEPGTLARREVAAWLLSGAAGWRIVPPTVLRPDAPLGEGSLQLFIPHDPEVHYFVLLDRHPEELATFALFDAVVNNADRKGGHVIQDPTGRLWAVDHGLTFHAEPKLRTVIWAFAEERLNASQRGDLEKLGSALSDGDLAVDLRRFLSQTEVDATLERVEALLVEDRFPAPGSTRPLPWPLI